MYPRSYLVEPITAVFLLTLLAAAACGQPSCSLGSGEESHATAGNTSGPVWPWQIYQSASFNPPELQITSNGAPLASGLVFITPSNFGATNALQEAAPLIMTDKGQLVWNGPILNATNFRVAKYEGKDILTYWSGLSTAGANTGHGYGNVTFLDSSYNEILVVCPKLGLVTTESTQPSCEADVHESFVTDRNTILVSAYNATPTDLSSIGGPKDGWIWDCLFYEIEPKSGNVLFHWSAIEHVPVNESMMPLSGTGNRSIPFDYFHINSVVNIGHGYLVNGRHVWTTYLLSASGDIEWNIQGQTGGDFGALPANGQFKWQHHARPHQVSNSSISLTYFNNNDGTSGGGSAASSTASNTTTPSNGLELKLSLPPDKSKTPEVLRYLSDPSDPISSRSQGSHELLYNGNTFLDFGQIPVLKEFGPKSPSGADIRWTARYGGDDKVQGYRGFKQEWHASPKGSPSLAVNGATANGCSSGYVSWNGATDVTAWNIYEGDSKADLTLVGQIGYKGFETRFNVAKSCVQAVALVRNKPTGSSNVICV